MISIRKYPTWSAADTRSRSQDERSGTAVKKVAAPAITPPDTVISSEPVSLSGTNFRMAFQVACSRAAVSTTGTRIAGAPAEAAAAVSTFN
ncbi:hypothetical protein ACFQ9X_53650 [Catenulispora yoronensis]